MKEHMFRSQRDYLETQLCLLIAEDLERIKRFGSPHLNQTQGAVSEVNGAKGIVVLGKCPPEI